MAKKNAEQIDKGTDQIIMTLGEMEGMMNSPLFQQALKKSYPMKVKYRLGVIVDKMTQQLKIAQKQREELIEKYSEKDDDGNPKQKLDDNGKKTEAVEFGDKEHLVLKELRDLSRTETTLNTPKITIDLDALEEKEKEKRDDLPTAEDFAMLMKFIHVE